MQALLQLAVIFIMIYGLCWMIGGPNAENGYARGTNRLARRGVRHVGRTAARAANAFPSAAGIFVIVLLIIAAGRC